MKARHTSGPWQVRVNGVYLRVVHGEHKTTVADSIVSEANARLIASAPELLKALKAMVLNDRHTYRDCHKAALAAIAKAEGEA